MAVGIKIGGSLPAIGGNTPATGAPGVSGTPRAGETLTASTSGISDEDGLTGATYSYQWIRIEDGTDTEIPGATQSTYTVAADDEGRPIKVRVTFTDDAGNEETLTSYAVLAAAAAESLDRPYNLEATTGSSAITLTWQDPDTHASFDTYVILRHRPELGEANLRVYAEYVSITDRTFTDDAVEPGVLYVYAVKAVKDFLGFLGPASDPLEVRMPSGETEEAPEVNNPATGAPAIIGTVQVDETLTADITGIADEDGLDDVSYGYQWLAGGTDLDGATGSTYQVSGSDVGKTIQVRVSFTDAAGNEETLTSDATDAVAAAAATAFTAGLENGPQSHDGQTAFTFELRFSEEPEPDFSYRTLRDHALTVTGGAVTKARRLDAPSNIRWEITVEPDGNGDVTIVLPVTTDCDAQGAVCAGDGRKLSNRLELTVGGPEQEEDEQQQDQSDQEEEQEPQSPPPAPTSLTATVNGEGHIVLSWQAPNDDSVTGYQILRRRPSQGEDTLLVYATSTAATYTDSNVTAGVKHVYRVKAINAAGLSGWSNYVNPTP